jgi:hypothetical protein
MSEPMWDYDDLKKGNDEMSDPLYAKIGDPLICLAEECAEVIQAVMKIQRFGIDSVNPKTGVSAKDALNLEISDLCVRILEVDQLHFREKV